MRNFTILLKKNLLEMVRNKRIIIFGIIFVAFAIISAVSAKLLPELINKLLEEVDDGTMGEYMITSSVADSYIQYISNIGETITLVFGILFAATIVKEKVTGTYDFLKMNKVKDRDIVLAHLLAQTILVTASYVVGSVVFVLLNIALFGQIMGIRGFVALLYLYLVMLFVIAFSMFCSCISRKKGISYVYVIIGIFVLRFFDVLPKINKFLPFHLLTVSNYLMYQESYSLSENLISVASVVVITALLVITSLFIVKNRINNKKVIDDGRETKI